MKTISKTICAGLVLAGIAVTSPLLASDEARELALKINDANSRLRSGEVDAAITAYQQASESAPTDSDLTYNLAVAQYRKGDVAAAGRLFQMAAATEDDAVAAKARYNLGNCNFAAAVRDAEKDRAGAIKRLKSAIGNYRSALDVDSSDSDARANIERAAALIDKLKEEEKKEQESQLQQQKSSQQKKQEQDKQDTSQDSKNQKSESDQQQDKQQDKQQNEKQGQNSQQQAQDQESQQQQHDAPSSAGSKKDEQQKQNEQQSGKQSKEEKSNPDKSDQNKSQQANQNNAEQEQPQQSKSPKNNQSQQSKSELQQDKPEKSAGDQKQQDAKPPQSKSESQQNREQRSLNENPTQSGSDPPEQAQDGQGKTPPKGSLSAGNEAANDKREEKSQSLDVAKEGEMTAQEAEKMLQSIRDREMLRRLRRQAAERERHVPVDRDW